MTTKHIPLACVWKKKEGKIKIAHSKIHVYNGNVKRFGFNDESLHIY